MWRAELAIPIDTLSVLRETLSPDEQERASKYGQIILQEWFAARRGLLRLLLSSYLQIAPQDAHFHYNEFGKPELADNSLHFNLSHSDGVALYAVSLSNPVGVDLERVKDYADFDRVAEACFTSDERALPRSMFFTLWARKEACAKAEGKGLTGNFLRYNLPHAYRPCTPMRTATATVYDIDAGEGYCAAVAIIE